MLGSLSYFKDGWAGSHNFKFGGEFFNERFDDLRGQDGLGQVPSDVLMILRNGVPSEVLLFQSPSASLNGLWTTGLYASDVWRVNSRLTFNARRLVFDRYRSYLPAQTGPPVGPFNPTQVNFPAVDNLITWNMLAPRARPDLRPDRQRQDRAEGELRDCTGGIRGRRRSTRSSTPIRPTGTGGTPGRTPTETSVWQHGEQGAAPTSVVRRRGQHAARSRTFRTSGRASSRRSSNAR